MARDAHSPRALEIFLKLMSKLMSALERSINQITDYTCLNYVDDIPVIEKNL